MFKRSQDGNSLAVFSKMTVHLQWGDENLILDFVLKWLLNGMVVHSDTPALFRKLTKVVKSIVDCTVAQGPDKANLKCITLK